MDLLPQRQMKQICIIGAGPTGLAALKVIKDAPRYKDSSWVPIVFEARENLGGIWLPAPPTDNPPLTPLYDSLRTNIPHPVMAYPSYPFPPSTPIFPHASVVHEYLASYAKHFDLMPHIRFQTSVESVERQSGDHKWKVRVSSGETCSFDLVMVCNGHYRVPRYPDCPGVEAWLKQDKATHSAWYRNPHNLGATILVVGGGPSGLDIAAEIHSTSRTVIHSSSSTRANDDIGNLKSRGRVSRFGEVDKGQVVFEDGSIETGIDHCILATGYQTSFPFLSENILHIGIPPKILPLPTELYNTTYSVFPLAKHIFPLQDPSLVFMQLPLTVIPFPLVEAQARAVLHVFAHPNVFDPTREAIGIVNRYERLRNWLGDDSSCITKEWAQMKEEQFDYRDELNEFSKETFEPVVVELWDRVMYKNKHVLFAVWQELVKRGEAEEWVKDVGKNGKYEWVSLLERMLNRGKEMGLPLSTRV